MEFVLFMVATCFAMMVLLSFSIMENDRLRKKLKDRTKLIGDLERNYESIFAEQQVSQFEQSRLKKDFSELLKKLHQINTILNPEDKHNETVFAFLPTGVWADRV